MPLEMGPEGAGSRQTTVGGEGADYLLMTGGGDVACLLKADGEGICPDTTSEISLSAGAMATRAHLRPLPRPGAKRARRGGAIGHHTEARRRRRGNAGSLGPDRHHRHRGADRGEGLALPRLFACVVVIPLHHRRLPGLSVWIGGRLVAWAG